MADGPQSPRPGGAAPGGAPTGTGPRAKPPVRAQHGYVNEVRWTSGQGRQPYANREETATDAPAAAHEVEGGDRGLHSGVTQAQMAQLRGKP